MTAGILQDFLFLVIGINDKDIKMTKTNKVKGVEKSKKDYSTQSSLESNDPSIQKPKLTKLIISNFRAITLPVTIDLDEIVILVGPNNSGKSSILRAYEVAMSQGSKAGQLSVEDFPNGQIDSANLPTIELTTAVYDNTPGDEWIDNLSGENLVRERWVWEKVGDPKRQGYNIIKKQWDEKVPWGAPNVANSRRPIPHRIDAFDNPAHQAEEIVKILTNILNDKISQGASGNNYNELLEQIKRFRFQVIDEAKEEICKIQNGVSALMSEVFPDYIVQLDANLEPDFDRTVLFKSGGTLKMGPLSGYKSTIDNHGSGARRTLLWSALKFLEEHGFNSKKSGQPSPRPHLLLIDEPEICLHPAAIRDARNVLYRLPSSGNWQVMITTHSPALIDLSFDNTTIIRVDRNSKNEVKGTTLYRPSVLKLDEDGKKELKLLNIFDPYVAEFFFCENNIIVEGDTEYTAFRYIMEKEPDIFKNVHIIRARGKVTIASIAKILNQFSARYSILHDSDIPINENGTANSAWTSNQNILDSIPKKSDNIKVRLVASKINFEKAFFGEIVKKDKPYNALITLDRADTIYKNVKQLLLALKNFSEKLPQGVTEWSSLDELKQFVFGPP